MGFYVNSDTKTKAMKQARRIAPKRMVVKSVSPTRNDGQFFANTKVRKGFR